MPRRPWTEDELKRARKMRAAGHAYREIDKALGRRTGAAQQRLERISDGLFAERKPSPLRASSARYPRISLAIRRPVTLRYTARRGSDDGGWRLLPLPRAVARLHRRVAPIDRPIPSPPVRRGCDHGLRRDGRASPRIG
jgi:hypothetical protein